MELPKRDFPVILVSRLDCSQQVPVHSVTWNLPVTGYWLPVTCKPNPTVDSYNQNDWSKMQFQNGSGFSLADLDPPSLDLSDCDYEVEQSPSRPGDGSPPRYGGHGHCGPVVKVLTGVGYSPWSSWDLRADHPGRVPVKAHRDSRFQGSRRGSVSVHLQQVVV